MKRFIIVAIFISTFFTACKKDYDNVFDRSPDQRINEALNSYQSTLTSAPNGWKAFITTDSGRGSTYGFYFKFSTDNRVKMYSDFDTISAVTSQTSSYRLKAQQQPTLIFDTYSYVHLLADPNEGIKLTDNFNLISNVNISQGGQLGIGLLSDFEFIIDNSKIKADTVELRGKVYNTKLILVKATKAEEDAYNSGQLISGLNINKILTYFKRLAIGAQLYDVRIDPFRRQFVFNWLDASGNLQTFTTGYYFIPGSIIFSKPFVNGGATISSFTNITWNQTTETVNLNIGNTPATVTGTIFPLKVDVNAATRWYQFALTDPDEYSVSASGFHVNGVDDAYNLASLPNFYFLLFLPQYGTSGGINYDLLGYVFLENNSLSVGYGSAFRPPVFTTDGRIIFSFLGTLGSVPTSNNSVILNIRTKMSNASGYYFVQTGENTYDMVSALDGKAWITWEPF